MFCLDSSLMNYKCQTVSKYYEAVPVSTKLYTSIRLLGQSLLKFIELNNLKKIMAMPNLLYLPDHLRG